jgi:hypothetical protein
MLRREMGWELEECVDVADLILREARRHAMKPISPYVQILNGILARLGALKVGVGWK